MPTNLKVGVTGGIGSGKSLICRIFAILGAPVYNADSRARWLMENSVQLKEDITAAFGPEAYVEGVLNRNLLASKVFNNSKELERLNAIVHPAVGNDYNNWAASQTASYTIKEAALMFESGSYRLQDLVINISAPETLRIQRVLKRDTFRTEEEIKAIIARQLTEEERTSRSDYIIYNDDQHLVIPQVLALDQKFKSQEAVKRSV